VLNRDAKFLRHHLAHGETQAGADIHLTRINGDRTIGVHGEETVDLFPVERFAEIGADTCLLRWAAMRQSRTQHKAHHDRAASPEHISPGHHR
jgi:hypothetical protein